MLKML